MAGAASQLPSRLSGEAQPMLMLLAPALFFAGRQLLLHANLSGMLPSPPQVFYTEFAVENSSAAAACALTDSQAIDHHCQICPTCSHRLTGHRCKLVCVNCGYYLSCADYY
jgi:hypothetical protein